MASRTSSGDCARAPEQTGNEPSSSEQNAFPLTREQRRSRRRHKVRGSSINTTRLSRLELELGKSLYPPEENLWKPQTRADCASVQRPCPYLSCKHNLYLDVSARTGSIKMNFPDLEVDQMVESCALDVADRGGTSLEEVGAAMNLTRERVRQLENSAMAKLNAVSDTFELRDFIDIAPAKGEKPSVLSADDFDLDGDG